MTTDANLVGRGDNANPNQANGQNADSTANLGLSDPQQSEGATPATPPINPEDKEDDDNGLNIDQLKASIAPATTTITLPLYLERVTDSREGVNEFIKYINFMYVNVASSMEFIDSGSFNERVDRLMTITNCFKAIVYRAANKKIGPAPDKSEDTLRGPSRPVAYEMFKRNPYNDADVQSLQDWILRLQDLSENQELLIAKQEEIEKTQSELIATLHSKSSDQQTIIRNKDQIIAKLQAQIKLSDAQIPEANQGCTLLLNTSNERGLSEVEFIQTLLSEHRQERMAYLLQMVKDHQFEEAFVEYQAVDQANALLGDLNTALTRQVHKNYLNSQFAGQADKYNRRKVWERDMKNVKYNYFFDELLGLPTYEDEDEENTVGEANAGEEVDAEQRHPEPEYLNGLDEVERDIMADFKAKGLKGEDLS